ncbi:hypothetical protein QFC22_005879 [Naganishia vaughanmartiniae]|uniref:Uncharacterized protein n=1 Tax=Naganishia vaughanmartiniae TaxID=1424756 RepID=A0ACC2WSD0_9TREE|nr:hypothetical protein QFC22_005879 [Naganishia vaughanmartiniae]
MVLVAHDALSVLDEQGIEVVRANVGSFMTSCNLPGFSLTLLLLPRAEDQPLFTAERILLELLDASALAPGWKPLQRVVMESDAYVKDLPPGRKVPFSSFETFQSALRSACENVIQAEPEITHFDTIAGDGDCGLCLKAGAEEILKAIDDKDMDWADCINSVLAIAQAIGRKMDGTSGALYNIWTNALAAGFSNAEIADASAWARALSHALATLYKYTAARCPSRTLINPLQAFTEALSLSQGQDLTGAVDAAVKAAEHTRPIDAKGGRAAYVGQDALRKANVPDPGAWGVVKILQGIERVIEVGK